MATLTPFPTLSNNADLNAIIAAINQISRTRQQDIGLFNQLQNQITPGASSLNNETTGTGKIVLQTSPTLISPTLGAASATSLAFSSTSGIIGTTANDSAAAGSVGEYISSTILVGSAVNLTTGTPANITSISLTAGDWDAEGFACFNPSGTTTTSYMAAAISTTSATFPTAPAGGFTQFFITNNSVSAPHQFPTGVTRISISSTTTVYLVVQLNFGVSTAAAFGLLRARRVR